LQGISSGILIEDRDLSAGELIEHMLQYELDDIRVYDLSKALRLSVNHVYWITKRADDPAMEAELIWPR